VAKRKGKGRKKGKKKKGSILRSKRTARLMELAKAKNRPYVVRSIKRGRTGVIRNRKKDYRWGIRKNKKALPPGWRVSRSGKLYYEARRNRSDSPRSRI